MLRAAGNPFDTMKTKIKPLVVTQFGNPVLAKKALPVPTQVFKTKKFQLFLKRLLKTMHTAVGVGIAAPQVGISWQVVVIEIKKSKIRPKVKTLPLTVLVNPRILRRTGAVQEDWEGCLSLPGVRAQVPRYMEVDIEYLDEYGKGHTGHFRGFQARVIQHELDHLQGVRYVERVRSPKSIMSVAEFKKRVVGKRGLSSR